ncbi:MAG: hypothetical protein R2880_14340 [Deinococcales bacterium]
MVDHALSLLESYQQFQENAVYLPLEWVGLLELSGSDRLDFLQGQLSHDVKGLKEGEHLRSLMLNVKGHALAEMEVYRHQDKLWVLIEDGAKDFVQANFLRHIIFDQVEIQDLSETYRLFSILGPTAEAVLLALGALPKARQFIKQGDLILSQSPRSALTSFDVLVKIEAAQVLENELKNQATQAHPDILKLARIEAMIPKTAQEGGEGILPQEAGLDRYLSYRKGCYIGQEIMARIEARGNLHRGLSKLQLTNMPSEKDIYAAEGDKILGRLGTVVEHPKQGILALAILRQDAPKALRVGRTLAERL